MDVKKALEKKKDSIERQDFILQKLEEEELILMCIFCIVLEYSQDLKPDQFASAKVTLLKYFTDNSFCGNL